MKGSDNIFQQKQRKHFLQVYPSVNCRLWSGFRESRNLREGLNIPITPLQVNSMIQRKPVAPKALKHLPAGSWDSVRGKGPVCTCPVSHTLSLIFVSMQSQSGDITLDIPFASYNLARLRGDASSSK